MNCQSFRNLQIKILLINSFYYIKIKLKILQAKKFLCVCRNYPICSLVRQDFGQSFLHYTSFEIVTQNSANFFFFCEHAIQRGKGFCARVQIPGRTAIPFLKKNSSSCKQLEQKFLKLQHRRLEEMFVDKKKLKTFRKSVGSKTVQKQLRGGKKKTKRRTS